MFFDEDGKEIIRIISARQAKAIEIFKRIYSNITKWEQQYNSMGDASVMIEYEDSGTIYGGGFELSTIQQQINTGRMWIIRFIY